MVKRKRDELSDTDSDDVAPGKQILPVANLPHDFDQEPQDGMQYLFLVRRDARRLPQTTRAPNPYEVLETTVMHTLTPPSTDVLPCEEWRIAFQTHFCYLRKNLTQTTSDVGQPGSKRRVIPEKKDRDAWWKFLAGHPESAWHPKDRSVRKPVTSGMRAFAYSAAAAFAVDWTSTEQARHESSPWDASRRPGLLDRVEPMGTVEHMGSSEAVQGDCIQELSPPRVTPSHIREIDHRMSIHLLMYFTHWINIHLQNPNDPLTAISVSHGQWIFALLTRIEDQLSADEMNLMRNLARACLGLIRKRKDAVVSADTTHMLNTSCWVIFAAVAGYWGQRDLWADAEATLASP